MFGPCHDASMCSIRREVKWCPMKYFVNISNLSNIDQTASEPLGKMRLRLMTCVSPGEIHHHEYAYPCQRAILFLRQ